MSEQLLFLLLASILIGGFIGGSTNMIAIKMLFRPWRPVYIGNVKLPLTPGVIPAKKRQLANKIATVVAYSIITPQAIIRAFEKTNIKQKLANKIISLIDKTSDNDTTLAHTLQKLEIDPIVLQENIVQTIASSLSELHIKDLAEKQINIIETKLNNKPIDRILPNSILEHINNKLPEIAYTLQENIANQIEEPETLLNIINSVQSAINIRNPLVKTIINGIIQEKQVQKQLTDKIQLFILSPTSNQQIVTMLQKNITLITSMSLQDIATKYPDEYISIKNNFIKTITIGIDSWLKTEKNSPLSAIANDLLTSFWKTPLKDIYNHITHYLPAIVDWFLNVIVTQLNNNLEQWLELFSIHSLVEDQVNSFPAEELEVLILKVAKRELSYITYFGILLGGLLGLIQFTITFFYVL